MDNYNKNIKSNKITSNVNSNKTKLKEKLDKDKDKDKKSDKDKKLDKKTIKIDDDFLNLENLGNQTKNKKKIPTLDLSKNVLVNNVDLLFSTNKNREYIIKNINVQQYSHDNVLKETNLKSDLLKYKQQIENYNNDLLSYAIQNCDNLENYYNCNVNNSDQNKFRGEYLIYIKDLIEYIKMHEIKEIIKNELNTFSNDNSINNYLIDINNYDISNLGNNNSRQIKNLNNFYIKTTNKKMNSNFIPKKRSI